MTLLQFYVDDIIKAALKEDVNYIDTTTGLLLDEDKQTEAYFVSKAEGGLCGIDVAKRVFEMLDDKISFKAYFKDGDKIKKGDVIAEMTGSAKFLLIGERTALNLIQHMSGIATATNRLVTL